jgi:NAD(P)-dependent dehydrogenase (short-subunit alcohol dehydrogenase family)
MQQLNDRIGVVTGAASGIGLGIAHAFANAGMKVVMSDVDQTRLAREVAAVGEHRAMGVVCDVADPDAVEALADRAQERFGPVDVVCNNAGIIRGGSVWELPLADWEAVLNVNLKGVLHGVRTFVPRMLAAGTEAHMVNVASMAAVVPVAGIGPYNVAKHGVLALSDTLAIELAAAGAPIGVTVVMPGRVPSRLGKPVEAPDEPEPTTLDPDMLAADDVGHMVVEAILHDRRYLFTHPERIPEVERRFARITARQPEPGF